jgi:predicted transcriptional regulator
MPENLQDAILALVPRRYPTKEALAKAIGISPTSLHNILGGKDPKAKTLAKLQRAGVRITPKIIQSFDP